MKIVTVGGVFCDIDGLGAGVAYAELLNLLGEPAQFVCTGEINGSVTHTIRNWGLPVESQYAPNSHDIFVVVDNSEPDHFEKFISVEQLDEIIDHHLGRESYWQDQGVKTDIEFIGACCTQIYERWVKSGRIRVMSELSARLLLTGILDNTLNFKASVTTERDKTAYDELLPLSGLREDWPARYFGECQVYMEQNLENVINNDTKQSMRYAGLDYPVAVTQLVVWDGKSIAAQKARLFALTEKYGTKRLISIVSISEGRNYLLSQDSGIRQYFGQLLEVPFEAGATETDRLWLRKEIIKEALDTYGT